MFALFGVDPEKLIDLWPTAPFLGSNKSNGLDKVQEVPTVKDALLSENENGAEVAAEVISDVEFELVSGGCVANGGPASEADALLIELRRAKIEMVRQKTKLLGIQVEIATMELAERRLKILLPPSASIESSAHAEKELPKKVRRVR